MNLYRSLLVTVIVLMSGIASAQPSIIKVKEAKILVNKVGGFSLKINCKLELGDSTEVDDEYWDGKPSLQPVFKVVYEGKKSKCSLNVKPYSSVSTGSVGFKITGFDESTLRRFMAKDNQITISVEKNIEVGILRTDSNGIKYADTVIIDKDDINKVIREDLEISDEERDGYLSALNNFYYYTNHVDFGVSPANTNTNAKTSYYLNYTFQNKFSSNVLKCDTGSSKEKYLLPPALYWSSSGRLSTIFNDSLNYINIYPLNIVLADTNYTLYLRGKLGHESNQTFTNKRVVADVSGSWVVPVNLINLTTAKDNRLRLKPIVDFGVKGYWDYSNGNTQNFSSGLAFLNGYYYIPVYNNYCIIFDGKGFYDLSAERNPSKKIMGNYSITVGAEVPKTGFKAIFKYTDGKTDINYKEGRQVLLGLLMDFIQDKKK